jgi:hypothetical protein
MLLDVMDDLLLQISVLKSRLDELQENTTTDVEREENDELLDCLAITSGHIAKHKDVIESGQVLGPKGGRRPNHISILQSAQTWKITLLTVVDTLAKRQREAAIDGQIEQMDFGEMEMERERDESPAKKASDSVIDGIHDSETRQRLLLRIGSGMDVGLSSSSPMRGMGGAAAAGGREEAFNGIKMLGAEGGGAGAGGGGWSGARKEGGPRCPVCRS